MAVVTLTGFSSGVTLTSDFKNLVVVERFFGVDFSAPAGEQAYDTYRIIRLR